MKGVHAGTVRELGDALTDATTIVARHGKGMLIEAIY